MSSNFCSVPTCVKDPKHACFILPKNRYRAQIWMERCGIEKNYADVTEICEAHFHKAMIIRTAHGTRLGKDAVPTLNLPPTNPNTANPSILTGNTDVGIPSSSGTNVGTSNQVNYSDFMENVIVNSLNAPLSQPNQPRNTLSLNPSKVIGSFKPMEVESSSMNINKKHGENSDDVMVKQLVSPDVESSSITNIKKEHNENFDSGIKTSNSAPVEPNFSYSAARKITELQEKIQFIAQRLDVLKMLAVKIYLKCPQAYEMLCRTLQLPPVSELKGVFDSCTISTDNDTLFATILRHKSEMMSVDQKHCVLCIGTIDVGKNLYFDIKRDKLIGVCDINNIQKPEPACKVLVLTMQGICTDWKQPIDIAYLNTQRYEDENIMAYIDQWIVKNISNLLKMGFKVRALVCETDYPQITTCRDKYRKIYYICDIMSLLKWFFYTFVTHDYIFMGERAKMQHILDYLVFDSKNNLRLSPKLTEKMLKPASIQDVSAKDVMEIINVQLAAAMTTYINLNVLEPAAKNTVKLITKMSTLLEVLCSNKSDNASRETRVLYDMISLLSDFKIINSVTNKEIAAEDNFVSKFQLTMRSILMLYEDMQSYNAKAFSAECLSLGKMRSFFDRVKQIKKDDTKPTCKNVYFAFVQSALLNILRSTHDKKCKADLEANLNEIENVVNNFKGFPHKLNIPSTTAIKSSEYNTLSFKNKDTLVLLAGFLQKKCYDRHSDCDDMKNYSFIVLQDTNSICKTILKEIQESVCVVPQESFIEFVEMMEIRFRSFMSKDIFESRKGFINGLLKAMQPVTFPMPCKCFPMLYAKKLYLRVRIYNMLKYNNNCLNVSPEQFKYLVVNNL